MKNSILLAIGFLTVLILKSQNVSLTASVSNISSDKGVTQLYLFDKTEAFPDKINLAVKAVGAKAIKGTQQIIANDSLYNIQDSVLIKTSDGAYISAMIVSRKDAVLPLPVLFQFTIYVMNNRDMLSLKLSADKGYVGVIAYTRGKKNSPSETIPYEYDGKDGNEVIDWISKQSWCNGKIGMHGGSYAGFTQWAIAKYNHPALKTIVPIVANRPGMGLPMENNIFINPNYQWAFYVTNNKTLDDNVNNDRVRFNTMENRWWDSGKAYRKIDSIDGQPNKLLQSWLQHPSYDKYWQNMVPFKDDFAKINIPVLAIDGYYNDSQISSLYYLKEHKKYNKDVEDYLIIGPYSHFGSQIGGDSVLNGYKVDSISLIGVRNIRFQWFDYILKGGKKPSILKDRINYEVMGANIWKSSPTLDKMSNASLVLFLNNKKKGGDYGLVHKKPTTQKFITQSIDFKDREKMNGGFYPNPIIQTELYKGRGVLFVSDPLTESIEINGAFEGILNLSINKKDLDLSVALYEQMPNGETFQLSYFVGRASYAKNIESRTLLVPNTIESIPFSNTRLVSKRVKKGSRILIVVNVIKTSSYQLNYGTGKDVSDETIEDAEEPLKIKWYNDSFIKIPIWKN